MKHWVCRTLLGLVVVLGGASAAAAAGFGIYEWGARGLALGGAMTARADDPSALVYNPAGITQLEGWQVQTGLTVIRPQASVQGTDPYRGGTRTTDANEQTWYVPHFYTTYKVNDRVSLGLGMFTRYGLGNDYDDNWMGRYNTTHASLATVSLAPTVAWKITDDFSLGFGLEFMRMTVNMHQMIDGTSLVYGALGAQRGAAWLRSRGLGLNVNDPGTSSLDYIQELRGEGYGVGGAIGLHYKLSEQWAVGLAYRSRISTSLKGRAKYKFGDEAWNNLSGFKQASQQLFSNTDVTTSITTPDSVHFGVVYRPLENLSIETGLVFTAWSTYDALEINYDRASLGRQEVTLEKQWNDTWRFNVGVEYLPVDWVALRAGYVFDQSPIQKGYEDYALPANDRHLLSAGLGFAFSDFTLDLAYTYLKITERTVDARVSSGVLAGKFTNGDAHLMAMTLGYAF